MKHLSALDATFLHLETLDMPMHVGALHLLDLPAGLKGEYIDALKRHIQKRMHLAAVFGKKLVFMPLDIANPVWVDAGDVDLDYHIGQVSLPAPGTQLQLETCVARLHAGLLDRSRPLWEFYLIGGLKSGQVALYVKIHHAALDGQGAGVLAQALLDVTAAPRRVRAPPPREGAPHQVSAPGMLKAALRDTYDQCAKLVRGVPTGVRAAAGMLAPGADGRRRLGWPVRLALAPRTPFNVSITSRRAYATVALDLKQALALGKTYGGTLNDVVLCIVSGALRRYLDQHGALPDEPLVAAVPVSLRAEGDTQMNNQVSMMLMKLATDQADPVLRMHAIVKASAQMKKTVAGVKSVLPIDCPSLGLPWLLSVLVSLYARARLADALPPVANVIVSNVPGPRVAMYLAGARVTSNFPLSIVTHGLALNVTVQSYDGALNVGLLACRRALPDIGLFAACMAHSHQELLAAGEPGAPKKRATASKTAPRKARVAKAA
ncbi:WS/DGAT/MGAT family O-acyltransferase [Massilia sp. TSP1-1-2]|uniref:WS/DGAT/MGAT family O-acyltransferase n=1 Tax=Massilia sp. TSP1-1-2 TaxID=2804649 RepID=UPI003CEBA396